MRVVWILLFLGANAITLIWTFPPPQGSSISNVVYTTTTASKKITSTTTSTTIWRNTNNTAHHPNNNKVKACSFRFYEYPSRYYGISTNNNDPPPLFLEKAKYVYGELPFGLHGDMGGKFCVDDVISMDGTNPSIVSIAKLHQTLQHSIRQTFPTAEFVVSVTLKYNHQCQHHSHVRTKPWNREWRRQVDLLIVDSHMNTLATSTIRAPPGSTTKNKVTEEQDDGRLFVNQEQQLWIAYKSFRAGLADYQLFAPLRLTFPKDQFLFQAELTSAPVRVCCGRNIGVVQSTSSGLDVLVWPNPVTVSNVQVVPTTTTKRNNVGGPVVQLSEPATTVKSADNFTSVFHGTSGALISLEEREFLGIGHFRRHLSGKSEDRNHSYARYGHHYTHAFFTIQQRIDDGNHWTLSKLSPEFVFPSPYYAEDAEIIQFASGLELVRNDTLYIGYGKNDCEASYLTLSLQRLYQLLRPIQKIGTQVSDLMDHAEEKERDFRFE